MKAGLSKFANVAVPQEMKKADFKEGRSLQLFLLGMMLLHVMFFVFELIIYGLWVMCVMEFIRCWMAFFSYMSLN